MFVRKGTVTCYLIPGPCFGESNWFDRPVWSRHVASRISLTEHTWLLLSLLTTVEVEGRVLPAGGARLARIRSQWKVQNYHSLIWVPVLLPKLHTNSFLFMCFGKPFSYITRRKEKKRRREAGRKRGSKERERGVNEWAKKEWRRDEAEAVQHSETVSSVDVEQIIILSKSPIAL